jgi:hypothetical protein
MDMDEHGWISANGMSFGNMIRKYNDICGFCSQYIPGNIKLGSALKIEDKLIIF